MRPMEEAGPLGPLLPHDWSEFLVGIALFCIVWFVVAKYVVPKFEAMYAERTAAIEGGMEKASAAEAQAQAALATYNAKLAGAEDEAATIREEARTQGAQILSESRAKATDEADRIIAQAETQIEAQRTQAEQQLKAQVGGMATTLAGKIVGENLDDERANRTIDRFLAELEAEHA